jgi:hypothetical protein
MRMARRGWILPPHSEDLVSGYQSSGRTVGRLPTRHGGIRPAAVPWSHLQTGSASTPEAVGAHPRDRSIATACG